MADNDDEESKATGGGSPTGMTGGEKPSETLDLSGDKKDTGTGAGTQANTYVNNSGSNAILQTQEANKAKDAEALARRNANNMAQANMQVTQAGLQEQGAGNAILNQQAQDNSQNAANFMLESNADDAQAQVDAARLAAEEQERGQKTADENLAHYYRLVENGQFDEADEWSKQYDLGLSTSTKRYERLETDVDKRVSDLTNALEAGAELDPVTRMMMEDELNYYKKVQDDIAAAKRDGKDYSQIVGDVFRDPNSFSDPYNKMTDAEIWAWDAIKADLYELQRLPQGNRYLNEIAAKIMSNYGYSDMNAFWNSADDNAAQIQEYGYYVGLVMRGLKYGQEGNIDLKDAEREKLKGFLGTSDEETDGNTTSGIMDDIANTQTDFDKTKLKTKVGDIDAFNVKIEGLISNNQNWGFKWKSGTWSNSSQREFKRDAKRIYAAAPSIVTQVNDIAKSLGLNISLRDLGTGMSKNEWKYDDTPNNNERIAFKSEYENWKSDLNNIMTQINALLASSGIEQITKIGSLWVK